MEVGAAAARRVPQSALLAWPAYRYEGLLHVVADQNSLRGSALGCNALVPSLGTPERVRAQITAREVRPRATSLPVQEEWAISVSISS